MADITTDAPTLVSATRNADGSIRVTWENNAKSGATYGEVSFHARVAGATGAYTRIGNVTGAGINTRSYNLHKAPNGAAFQPGVGYDIALRAAGPAGESAYSSSRTVPAMQTATPSIDSVSRVSATSGNVIFSIDPVAPATLSSVYLYSRRKGTSTWTQVNSTGNGTARQVRVPNMDGLYAYEVRLQAAGPAGLSGFSAVREVPSWFTVPAAVTDLLAARSLTGSVKLTWSATETDRAPITGFNLYRATGATGQFTLLKAMGATTRSFTDGSASGSTVYRYQVAPYNQAGEATSRPTVTSNPELPPAPTNLLAARNTDGTVTLTWARGTGGTVSGYRIYRATGATGQFVVLTTKNATSHTDTTAKADVDYRYAVEAYNAAGASTSRPTVNVGASLLRPNPPSQAPTVAYVAPNQAALTWNLNVASNRPYTGQRIRMRTVGTTAWSTVADVGPAVTTATVTVGANKYVEFAIEPYNGAGLSEATSPISAKLATVPAVPASLTARWGTGSNIITTWPDFSSIGNGIDVEFSTNGGDAAATWHPGTTPAAPLPITARSWQHTGVTVSVPHWYRLRVRRTDIEGAPASGWIYSGKVEGQTKPNPPTVVRPDGLDATEAIRLALIHNPVDGTPLTAAQIRYRVQGTTSWTTRTLGAASVYDIAPGTFSNGQVLEVQGQTAGASGVYSDWSPSTLLVLRARPTVAIVSPPAGSWPSPTLPVEWTATAQVEAVVELLDAQGGMVDSRQVGADVRRVEFKVEDRAAYTVRVTVTDAYQASLPASVVISVELERPAPPDLRATFREDDPDYPASVLLQARPVTGYNLIRANYAQDDDNWEGGDNAPPVASATLTNPDTGETVDASIFEFSSSGQDVFHTAVSVPAGGSVVGTVTLTSFTGAASVEVGLVSTISGWSSVAWSLPIQVPVWPATITVTTDVQALGVGALPNLRLRSVNPSAAYAFNTGLIVSTDLPINPAYFDESSTSDVYHYVRQWDPWRVSEVTEAYSGSGDFPVAQTVRIEFWRSADDGKTWQRVGDAGPDWSLVDTQPPLLARLLYRARAYAEQGGWAESNLVEVSAKACDAFLHYAGVVLRGGYEPSYTGTAGRQSVLRRYVGRDKPSAVFGDRAARTQAYRITLLDDSTPLARWVTAAEHPGTVTVRDPGGRVLGGILSDFSWDDSTEDEQTVSFTVTESEALP